MNEALETRRMLEWFKAQLPRHDLGDWAIEAQPEPPPIQVEGGPMYPLQPQTRIRFRIRGHATCQRCGGRFYIPASGDALALDEEWIPRTTEKMKQWAEREADKPCWGDVPTVRDDCEPTPALDSIAND